MAEFATCLFDHTLRFPNERKRQDSCASLKRQTGTLRDTASHCKRFQL